jgi:nucleoid-associated protein YgaU
VVVRGETVWSIAKTIAREQDPRPIVADIIDLNRIENAAIFPGQVLRVPPAG